MSTIFHRAPRAKLRGLMVYPMGGTVDGSIGDHVLLAPPFICDSQQIEAIVGRLADAIELQERGHLSLRPR